MNKLHIYKLIHIKEIRTKKIGIIIFKWKSQGYNGSNGQNKVCTHSGRTNHTMKTCFLKNGFPPRYKGKGNIENTPGASSQTTATINNVSDSSPQESTASFFTQEKYYNILELLQQPMFNS